MNWDLVDWKALERLRDGFLNGNAAAEPYWETESDLQSYDFTFGRRISWKWAAMLEHLRGLGWKPPTRTVVDWGCGTGIASRSLLAYCRPESFDEVVIWDHSAAATSFARSAIEMRSPKMVVRVVEPGGAVKDNEFILVVSHVLNELDGHSRDQLVSLARRAAAVLWIEPGTWKDSRSLIAVREELRESFSCWSPCPHNERCGMLAEENHQHWCHHFATPPTEAFTESGWGRFSRLIGIDPRSLPYSHLVLDRTKPTRTAGLHRLIGRPRQSTGISKLLTCSENGVDDLELQKRDVPSLWKALDKGRHRNLFALEVENGRITGESSHSPQQT